MGQLTQHIENKKAFFLLQDLLLEIHKIDENQPIEDSIDAAQNTLNKYMKKLILLKKATICSTTYIIDVQHSVKNSWSLVENKEDLTDAEKFLNLLEILREVLKDIMEYVYTENYFTP